MAGVDWTPLSRWLYAQQRTLLFIGTKPWNKEAEEEAEEEEEEEEVSSTSSIAVKCSRVHSLGLKMSWNTEIIFLLFVFKRNPIK